MILLLGATGYVGQAFAAELRQRGLEHVAASRQALDYTRFEVLFDYVRTTRPRLVINAAGFTGGADRDACERNRAETVRANTLLPQTIGRVCYLTETPLGHVSSGCIYAGGKFEHEGQWRVERELDRPEVRATFDSNPERFRGFDETDEPNATFRSPPCSFYAGSKALAEESLRWTNQLFLWRPGLMFDEQNHPRNLLSQLQQYPELPDCLSSVSHRGEFVRTCLDLWERGAAFGPYHIVNPGPLRLRETGDLIGRVLQVSSSADNASARTIYPIGGALQQASCLLATPGLDAAGIRLRPTQQCVQAALENWRRTPQEFQSGSNVTIPLGK